MCQLKSMIRTVEKQIANLEKAIARHLKSDEEIAEKVNNVCTIKGSGTNHAWQDQWICPDGKYFTVGKLRWI